VVAAALVVGACSSNTDPAEPAAAVVEESPEATAVPTAEPEIEPRPEPTVAAAPCPSVPPGATDTTLTVLGNAYDVRVFVPSTFDGQAPLPVVLDWHGLGSNGTEQRLLSGYETLAEAEGFVVVHATGLPDDIGRPSWQLFDAPDSGRDDLAFADLLIDELVANWCADPARVYSTGMSNGGFFTARLVCERADRLAAAVSVAGTYHLPDCTPARPVPYIAYHGTADVVVPFAGGDSILADDDPDSIQVEFFDQVMPAEFAEFADDSGCGADPAVANVSDEVIRYDYTGCADDVPMSFFEITGGGHTWPNSPVAEVLGDALGYFTLDVDATVDGWAFMAEHSLD
jgi:polyhydroxybutyrate depolymerase